VAFRQDGKISESRYHNSDGSIVRTSYVYDDAARLVELQSWTNDTLQTKTLHVYDAEGRLSRTIEVAADGSRRDAETYRYDKGGRKTKVEFVATDRIRPDAMFVAVVGSTQGYGVPGATTGTTTFDDRDFPSEAIFHDVNHAVVRRVTFTRGREGRVLSEVVRFGDEMFPELNGKIEKGTPEERASLDAFLATVFADQTLISTTYSYDEKGRVLERTHGMGSLGGTRTTYRYDDHDNPVEETSINSHRGMSADEHGNSQPGPESSSEQHVRYEYQYDTHGNWTERVVSGWSEVPALEYGAPNDYLLRAIDEAPNPRNPANLPNRFSTHLDPPTRSTRPSDLRSFVRCVRVFSVCDSRFRSSVTLPDRHRRQVCLSASTRASRPATGTTRARRRFAARDDSATPARKLP
jgi:hypothetical protein